MSFEFNESNEDVMMNDDEMEVNTDTQADTGEIEQSVETDNESPEPAAAEANEGNVNKSNKKTKKTTPKSEGLKLNEVKFPDKLNFIKSLLVTNGMVSCPDSVIPVPEVRQALEIFAKNIGFAYDPEVTHTFKISTYEEEKYLNWLTLVSNGKQVCLQWGKHMIPFEDDYPLLERKPFFFQPGTKDYSYSLTVLPKQLNFPIKVGMDRKILGKDHQSKLVQVETMGDLKPYLKVYGETGSLSTLEGDAEFLVESYVAYPKKDKPDTIVLAVTGLEDPKYWGPGDGTLWKTAAYPVKVFKTGYNLSCADANGNVFEITLGRRTEKLSTLTEGETYQVVGYEGYDTQWGYKYSINLIVDGEVKAFDSRVKSHLIVDQLKMEPEITESNPALLTIDKIKEEKRKDDKGNEITYHSVTVRFKITAAKNDTLMQEFQKYALKSREEADSKDPALDNSVPF